MQGQLLTGWHTCKDIPRCWLAQGWGWLPPLSLIARCMLGHHISSAADEHDDCLVVAGIQSILILMECHVQELQGPTRRPKQLQQS